MIALVLAAYLLMPLGQTDTTFAVPANSSLEMLNTSGRITISTWSRQAIRIRSSGDADDPVDIQYINGVVHLRTRSERGVARPSISIGTDNSVTANVEVRQSGGPLPHADYDITVPASMALDVAGIYSEISITGTRAPVHATAVHGNLILHGGVGTVSLENLEGQVTVDGASGTLTVNAPNNSVDISHVTGRASIKSVNGGIRIQESNLSSLDAGTYNGAVSFSGQLAPKGTYVLSTFNGKMTFAMLGSASATIDAATVKGQITVGSSLSETAHDALRRRTVVFGAGAARVKLQTFDGDIVLTGSSTANK